MPAIKRDDGYNPEGISRKGAWVGHSKADKTQSHARIVQVAAERFREVGIDGVGVADLMHDAGLTHGGFYRHFASRDQLVAEAVEAALLDGSRGVGAIEAALAAASGDKKAQAARRVALLHALIDYYTGLAHRDQLATSCAVTTLAADVARSTEPTRTSYTRQVEVYLQLLVRLIDAERVKSRRRRAVFALATLVGAVSLARAVNDAALSEEILRSAANELKAQLAT
jgi:TetR/AcrR family transcriptional repressor of nem operon